MAQRRYAIWNNKGGVGKTFITFAIATEYARVHPQERVVVVDMCPQANVSEIILGGNGQGSDRLAGLLRKSPRQTIGGYFDQRINQPHSMTGTETSFLVNVSDINKLLPKNMSIVAGDPSLEVQTQAINQIARQVLPVEVWRNVHRWLLDLISAITIQNPSSVFFIDCNPSFAAYTELALAAANRLIIPCTADGSSARAIDNVAQLLYGVGVPAAYQTVNFAALMRQHTLSLPSVHLVPLNRSTQYGNQASKAFRLMYEEIQNRVDRLQGQAPQHFSISAGRSPFFDIPDAHQVAIVASHQGRPLNKIEPGLHDLHEEKVQVNEVQLVRYKEAISKLVTLL